MPLCSWITRTNGTAQKVLRGTSLIPAQEEARRTKRGPRGPRESPGNPSMPLVTPGDAPAVLVPDQE